MKIGIITEEVVVQKIPNMKCSGLLVSLAAYSILAVEDPNSTVKEALEVKLDTETLETSLTKKLYLQEDEVTTNEIVDYSYRGFKGQYSVLDIFAKGIALLIAVLVLPVALAYRLSSQFRNVLSYFILKAVSMKQGDLKSLVR